MVGSFSALGFWSRERLWDWPDAPVGSMEGKVALVTGATSGIGRIVATELAKAGATVVASGRNPDKLASLVAELRLAALGPKVGAGAAPKAGSQACGEVADLSSLAETRAMARRVADAHPRLDVVVHCAGGLHSERKMTAEGFELTGATQVLAPFLITTELAGPLAAAAPSRVITVTSGGAYASRLSVRALGDPPEPYRGAKVYSQAKRAQIVLTQQWAERLAPSGVAVHVMHPGWVDTPGLVAGMPGFHRVMGPVLRSPAQGADTVVWLASAAPGVLGTGKLWLDRRPRGAYHLPGTAETATERDALWAWCERVTRSGAGP